MMSQTDPDKIARDFATIPFEDHEARILAEAYLALASELYLYGRLLHAYRTNFLDGCNEWHNTTEAEAAQALLDFEGAALAASSAVEQTDA